MHERTNKRHPIHKAMALAFAEAGADVILHYNTRREGAEFTFREINCCHREVRMLVGKEEKNSWIRLPGSNFLNHFHSPHHLHFHFPHHLHSPHNHHYSKHSCLHDH